MNRKILPRCHPRECINERGGVNIQLIIRGFIHTVHMLIHKIRPYSKGFLPFIHICALNA